MTSLTTLIHPTLRFVTRLLPRRALLVAAVCTLVVAGAAALWTTQEVGAQSPQDLSLTALQNTPVASPNTETTVTDLDPYAVGPYRPCFEGDLETANRQGRIVLAFDAPTDLTTLWTADEVSGYHVWADADANGALSGDELVDRYCESEPAAMRDYDNSSRMRFRTRPGARYFVSVDFDTIAGAQVSEATFWVNPAQDATVRQNPLEAEVVELGRSTTIFREAAAWAGNFEGSTCSDETVALFETGPETTEVLLGSTRDAVFEVWRVVGPDDFVLTHRACDERSLRDGDERFTVEPSTRYVVTYGDDDTTTRFSIADISRDDPAAAPDLPLYTVFDAPHGPGFGHALQGCPRGVIVGSFVAETSHTRVEFQSQQFNADNRSFTVLADTTGTGQPGLDDLELVHQRCNARADREDARASVLTEPGTRYWVSVNHDTPEAFEIVDGSSLNQLRRFEVGSYTKVNEDTDRHPIPTQLADMACNNWSWVNLEFAFEATSTATRLSTTDSEVIVQILPADGQGMAICDTARMDEDRANSLVGPLQGLPAGVTEPARLLTQTVVFDTIPGNLYYVAWHSDDGGEGVALTEADATPATTVTVSCLAGNGRIDVNLVNNGSRWGFGGPLDYTVTVGEQITRQLAVNERERGRTSVTGRSDGEWIVEINEKYDGYAVALARYRAIIDCDSPTPAATTNPEVRVISACQNGLGFVFFQFRNPTDLQRSWVIEFEGVANRSTTAAAQGASVRGVSGRPNGTYDARVSSNGNTILETEVVVDC